ncbi:hypothetical protein Dsin_017545 [Dipteronia sinensis]|uniref:non-specific serine/threonine protein kinase n=1 Tax=Dipteronia sinensis TaxID=43782 RepID=A0AAE0E6M7_9ROSI|nr:hypothetical protein Dsin_017545 [Dipteronia sinensis]
MKRKYAFTLVDCSNLSDNNLNGTIPRSFSDLPSLQKLSLEYNSLTGYVPANMWRNLSFSTNARLTLDLRYNLLSNIVGDINLPYNVTLSECRDSKDRNKFGNFSRHYSSGSGQCFGNICNASRASMKIDGVKDFKFKELAMATDNFISSTQMLVYEFVPNGTLRDWLSSKGKESLNFGMRLRVALDSAKGLLYLHTEANPPVFHRDIKAINILLDSKFNVKVADFGLLRLAPVLDEDGTMPTHVSTIVKGTPGYLDPEYFLTHKLTDKSDVYSLGVVLLELLTGMQPISHGKNIVREVKVAHQLGMMFSIIDSRMGSYPSECIEKLLSLALSCCHDKSEHRPSMLDVVRELENIVNMVPASDPTIIESTRSVFSGHSTAASSLTMMSKDPYMSNNVSGNDLVSNINPIITPR